MPCAHFVDRFFAHLVNGARPRSICFPGIADVYVTLHLRYTRLIWHPCSHTDLTASCRRQNYLATPVLSQEHEASEAKRKSRNAQRGDKFAGDVRVSPVLTDSPLLFVGWLSTVKS